VKTPERSEQRLRYDTLIVATGAEAARPPVPGIDRSGVYQIRTIDDSLTLNAALTNEPEKGMIVGAGYIGLEMAEALRARGFHVTVLEQLPTVLPTVDPQFGSLVRAELERNGVDVINGATVQAIGPRDRRLAVYADPHVTIEADIVLVVVGVKPDAKLGRAAGIETGTRGRSR
jgi:pyruvate/2-oxoglutarate dehydrogenase complex dihydrolipoamide dehydrogenase (E3) component